MCFRISSLRVLSGERALIFPAIPFLFFLPCRLLSISLCLSCSYCFPIASLVSRADGLGALLLEMAVRRHFQGAMVPGWAGLGLGIRQTWHRQDRSWGGCAIGSSPSNRSTFGIFGSSFNMPLQGVHRLHPPLPHLEEGGTANGTFLFISFVLPTFWPLQTEERGSGTDFCQLTGPTRTSHDRPHTHSEHQRFPMWTDFQISLALSGSTSWRSFHKRDEN